MHITQLPLDPPCSLDSTYQADQTRSWLEISASAFTHNIALIKNIIGFNKLALVLKSNAYGHGLFTMASLAQSSPQVDMLCTTDMNEACALRAQGISKPILALYDPFFSVHEAIQHDIHLGVYNYSVLDELIKAAQGKKIAIHLKIDTGMTRLGIAPENINLFFTKYRKAPLILKGLFTHLADKDNLDQSLTYKQLEIFERVVSQFKAHGSEIPYIHALSSGALHLSLDYSFLTTARVGAHCYGLIYSEVDKERLYHIRPSNSLQPILTWKTSLAHLQKISAGSSIGYNKTYTTRQPMTLGILPIGYADGLPRILSNTGHVIIRGQQAPIRGIISMNLTTVDVTHIADVCLHDEVTILGQVPGVTAYDIAQHVQTIPIDITTGLSKAITRIIT